MNNPIVINPHEIPTHKMALLAGTIFDIARHYYSDPGNVEKYIHWHQAKYGSLPSNHADLLKTLDNS